MSDSSKQVLDSLDFPTNQDIMHHCCAPDMTMGPQDFVRPLDGRILVDEDRDEKSTESGIILPENTKVESFRYATVVAIGVGRYTDQGILVKPRVKVGDRVAFADDRNARMVVDGRSYLLLRDGQIVATVIHKRS